MSRIDRRTCLLLWTSPQADYLTGLPSLSIVFDAFPAVRVAGSYDPARLGACAAGFLVKMAGHGTSGGRYEETRRQRTSNRRRPAVPRAPTGPDLQARLLRA